MTRSRSCGNSGYESFHVVGHDRGARVGHRMALDHPARSQELHVRSTLCRRRRHSRTWTPTWHSRGFTGTSCDSHSPLPETLIGTNAKFYLDFLLERWTAVEGSITEGAYAEYLRCFENPDTVRATCLDYRGIALDLQHDEVDRGRKMDCPVLLLWGADMRKRPGWQTGKSLDMLTVWRERAHDVRGKPLDCGHFIPEERPAELVAELVTFLSECEGR